MNSIQQIIRDTQEQRERDLQAFKAHDFDLCMICGAYGADKRNFWLECGYQMKECAPEFLDLFNLRNEPDAEKYTHTSGYWLCVCKSCRGAIFTGIKDAIDERRKLRGTALDHDGYAVDYDDESENDKNIPVRMIGGITVMMNADEYAAYKAKRDA